MSTNNKNTKMSPPTLIIGLAMFILLTFVSALKSNLDKDFTDFKVFKSQVKTNSYSILQMANTEKEYRSKEFNRLLHEIDLTHSVLMNSKFIGFNRKFNKSLDKELIKLQENWSNIDSFFFGDKNHEISFLNNSLSSILITIEYLDDNFSKLEKVANWTFFILVTFTLISFILLLLAVFYLSNRVETNGNQGLTSVRNALIQGQEQERLRISLELHDKVAQDLFAAKMVMTELSATVNSELAVEPFSRSISLIDQSIKEVRDLSYSLRPPALQAIGLDSAFKSYVENFSKKIEIPINFKAVGLTNKNIDESVSINLYRILQETLNNTAKHAHADNIDVKLIFSYPFLLLKIEDDGVGFNYVKSEIKAKGNRKLGLPGINERVSLIGGELIINSNKGEGTKILIKVPVEGNEKV